MTTQKRMSGKAVLAFAFGWDLSDVEEYRYQRYSSPSVYAIGDKYFAVSQKKPKHDVSGEWFEYKDEAATSGTDMKIWVAMAHTSGADMKIWVSRVQEV